jgi:energy-coupling factor transporter ATP-binding protein EcfA2
VVRLDFNPQEYIDDRGLWNAQGIAKELRKDKDWVFLVVGPERSGKSTLALIWAGLIDPHFDTKRICFPSAELRFAVQRARPYQAVIQDEGAESWLSTEGMSKESRKMVKMFMACGKKNLAIFIVIPDFQSVKRYLAKHRAHTLLRITRRGCYNFYSKNRIGKIKFEQQTRSIQWPKPNFRGYYRRPPKDTPFWVEYERKEKAHKFGKGAENPKVAEEEMRVDRMLSTTADLHDAAKMAGVNRGTLLVWVNNGVLRRRYRVKPIRTYRGWRIAIPDVLRLRKQLYPIKEDRRDKDFE